MKCPICGCREFEERFWNPEMRLISFEKRDISKEKSRNRRKHYYCANKSCGFRLYGHDEVKLKRELKVLENEVL